MKKEEREAQECGIRKKIENRRWKTDGTGGARIVWHLITLFVYQEEVICPLSSVICHLIFESRRLLYVIETRERRNR